MSSKLLLLLLLHFNHPEFQTEWWYYTGHLQSADGHRYGYELTFFRQANSGTPKTNSVWNSGQLYLAHLALSDIDGQRFEHFERLNRAGPGIAGAVWNGNWHATDTGLQAVTSDLTLNLSLETTKPPVVHGVDGISRKGPVKGEFSHYTSYTRLITKGTLVKDGKTIPLTGTSWMDNEHFNDVEDSDLQGWDWFAIQLDNNEELMLYRLRLKSGAVSRYSSGTLIDTKGQPHHLEAKDFTLTSGAYWNKYPLTWHLEIPSQSIDLTETTKLQNQELNTPNSVSPEYWEGAVDYTGTAHAKPVKGVGYLELTGYRSPLKLGH
jgi:predicted secreted hydrolase